MSGLSVFFAENVEKNKVVKYVASKRFKDEKGNPVEWQIGCVTSDEDEAIRKSCTEKLLFLVKRMLICQKQTLKVI